MKTTNVRLIAANETYIPFSAVIGGEDYVKSPTRSTPRGNGLWLSTGPYVLKKDYIHSVRLSALEGTTRIVIPAGSRVSLYRAGNVENVARWRVETPKGRFTKEMV